ncbi:MAG: mandelate racemase/muconate lactonizing enzyme family protein [Spirochaetaceae bacterium]
MKITDVVPYVLLAPNYDIGKTSSAQDSFVLEIRTDEGLVGIGETDANPWIMKACIEAPGTHTMSRGIKQLVVGADPLEISALMRRLYVGTAMDGRRGALIHALGAVEMALWDLKGKALGRPVYELLAEETGHPLRTGVTPYASLQPSGASWEEYRDSLVAWALRAKEMGFRAVKAEVTMNGPYAHSGLSVPYDRHTDVIAAVRKALGPDVDLMVDVQYMFDDFDSCAAVVRDWKEFNLFFLETPIWVDNLDDYGKLHDAGLMPIAMGEWLTTRHEFAEAMDRGKLDVVQPDVGRVGGLLETLAVADAAAERGRLVVPHCWKTGISISATVHMALVTPHCPYVEYLPPQICEEVLRRELVTEDLSLVDGSVPAPTKPGLGIELNRDAVKRFQVA